MSAPPVVPPENAAMNRAAAEQSLARPGARAVCAGSQTDRRVAAAAAMALFALSGCTDSRGRYSPLENGLLGAGLGAGAGLLGGAVARDQQRRAYRAPFYGHGGPGGYGHGRPEPRYTPPVVAPSYGYRPHGYGRGYGW